LETELLRRANTVFVLSQRGADAIGRTFPGIEAAKVHVLSYPVGPPEPSIRTGSMRGEGAELIIGFYGHWYAGKGIEALIEAVAQCARESPRLRLKLWGAPPQGGNRTGAAYRRRVMRSIERSGAAEHIEVLGRLPKDRVPGDLSICDAIVLPYEQPRSRKGLASASAVVFDAFAAGVPVVTTDVRALAEFVDDGVNGFVVAPGDPLALASTLRRLRDDIDLRVRLREGARLAARALAPELTAACTLDAYRRLT
jgi:glycosyltransferase involved in cell wall biosynthesis